MADKKTYSQYKYKVEMTYLNIIKGINTPIKNECIRHIIIDHNYDTNCMPIMYATMRLDKALVDDMILHANDNMILVAVYKYDDLTEYKEEVEVFRDRFIYFLPDDVNKNKDMDYNDINEAEHLGNTFREVSLGLMSARLINKNKRFLELNVAGNTVFDCAKYCLSEMDNLLIEPFIFSDTYERIIMPAQPSVNSALKFLNGFRVFYYTPYRFYMDFNYTYLISSSGLEMPKENELYSTVIIQARDVLAVDANDFGSAINRTSETIEIPLNYANMTVYDNTIANKSRSKLKGISSTGSSIKSLVNKASYMDDKTISVRLNNDNDNMLYNIESQLDSHNVFVYFSKSDLDMDILTINKRISIHHIDRYQEHNGDYLLARKRECLIREDDTFVLTTLVNMRKVERTSEVVVTPYNNAK